jgi:hypothetical protein
MMPTKNEIQDFSEMIAQVSSLKKMSIMDSILEHCEKTGMEIDLASSLVSTALKSKIREEAQELNLLKKNSKLPI